jgi:hypothetical protein
VIHNKEKAMPADKVQELYGPGCIVYSDLKPQLDEFGGEPVIYIVEEVQEDGSLGLSYGLFYKRPDGKIFDVIQTRLFKLKTYKRIEKVASTLHTLGCRRISIPSLDEENKIAKGAFRKD